MQTLSMYPVRNHEGQKLLDDYVLPICNRLGIRLIEAKPGSNRANALASQINSDAILWDCSVEPGHVYGAFNEWVKNQKRNVIVSRTSLPRNVLTYNQFAPIHGKSFSNDQLGEWLERNLPLVLAEHRTKSQAGNNPESGVAGYYWMFGDAADVFLSFRGTQLNAAKAWCQRLARDYNRTVRMVPEAEYSYRTECVTRQQMWEGVARLTYEMTETKSVIILLSEDYFDSFWTSSELLSLIKHRCTPDNFVERVYVIRDNSHLDLDPIKINQPDLPIKPLTSAQSHRLYKILNNSDPLTVAPETRIPARGLAKVLALFLRTTMGYYDPEFSGSDFWNIVQVPCLRCQPKRRQMNQVNWEKHLHWDGVEAKVDYFGYFPTTEQQLSTKMVECPNCHTQVRLKNVLPPRTLWVPIQTTEKDQERPIIEEHPVWEVIE